MATQGQKANWTDITALYTQLKTARQKFGFTPNDVTPASRQGQQAAVSDVTNLNSFITQMQSNANLTNIAKPVTQPNRGDLLQPLFVNTLATTITNIQNADNFSNSSFNSSFNSSYNSSFNSSFNSSYNSGYNSGFGNSSWGACNDNADCWWY